jgi:crotonobetainyl-CoA:carnitine CoA-transferase CaiB-like acyl-CoA transferase
MTDGRFAWFLGGLRVLEIGNELGEYCGKVLAGLGADVVRVEPPGGEVTRRYGPFYRDEPHPDRSLYFWHYNLGKRSIVLDLDTRDGVDEFRRLATMADVLLDSRPRGDLAARGLDPHQLRAANPRLIHARITPFGDTGPWADYEGSDLVHLALGGVMMNCGYDPDPSGFYETPPIAPQMWQAYQIAGEMSAMSILAALSSRLTTGCGQALDTSVHQAVSQNTETDVPDWVFLRQTHYRLTCRHSTTSARSPALAITKDGRYVLPYRTYTKGQLDEWAATVALLKKYGLEADLEDAKYSDADYREIAEARERLAVQTDKLVARLMYDRDIWREAQDHGLPWTPIRKPEENASDPHWLMRDSFFEVHHPELGETFLYTGGKWVTEGMRWRRGPRPPLVGEHTDDVRTDWLTTRVEHERLHVSARAAEKPATSPHGKPFPLAGVRVVDLSWMLASAGAGRFLAAMGAEVIKVEHLSRPDRMRFSPLGAVPPGGRAERDRAGAPLVTPDNSAQPNRGGSFMEINAGKLGMSLNLKHPRGREILEDLIRDADMVVEGYSPGTMIRMGLGYERLRQLNPSIIYVQQSGLGELGTYGRARTFGPSAQAITGISDMSGLPEPFPPAGIGYSYLDWFGAYNMAVAMLAALYRRDVTGEGCHIDASQGDTGIYLTGTAILDHGVNGRHWSRYGNRSPYKPAAPHGAYRARGDDRWIAISVFTEEQWIAVVEVLGANEWRSDTRFSSRAQRLEHQDELDALVGAATQSWEPFELMRALQARGVPAGVCQNAQDRVEHDPQLAHLGWLVELDQTDIGRWPVKEHPTRFSDTPTYIGGRWDRSGPSYGEDTDDVLARLLGLAPSEIAELRAIGAL